MTKIHSKLTEAGKIAVQVEPVSFFLAFFLWWSWLDGWMVGCTL